MPTFQLSIGEHGSSDAQYVYPEVTTSNRSSLLTVVVSISFLYSLLKVGVLVGLGVLVVLVPITSKLSTLVKVRPASEFLAMN